MNEHENAPEGELNEMGQAIYQIQGQSNDYKGPQQHEEGHKFSVLKKIFFSSQWA